MANNRLTIWGKLQRVVLAASPPLISSNLNDRLTQTDTCTSATDRTNFLNCGVNNFYNSLVNIFFLLMGAAAVLLLIWAGIQYITAAGNPDQVKKARQSIVNIVLGIIILVASYFVVHLIVSAAQGVSQGVSSSG